MKKPSLSNTQTACIKTGARFGVLASGAGFTSGAVLVEKTVLFGLITTGMVVSPWLVAACVATGSLGGIGGVLTYNRLQKAAIAHDFACEKQGKF